MQMWGDANLTSTFFVRVSAKMEHLWLSINPQRFVPFHPDMGLRPMLATLETRGLSTYQVTGAEAAEARVTIEVRDRAAHW